MTEQKIEKRGVGRPVDPRTAEDPKAPIDVRQSTRQALANLEAALSAQLGRRFTHDDAVVFLLSFHANGPVSNLI